MQVYDSITRARLDGPTHLTIGNFDGVHRGHLALIKAMQAAARAEGAANGLLTFHPHPRSVLNPGLQTAFLTSLSERLDLYAQAGLDFTIVHPFTRATAQTTAADFLHLLRGHLGVTRLWVGPDFALGRNREGDIPFLRQFGATLGVEIEVMPEFIWEEQAIRSSHIRRLVEIGNVEWASAWLGRYYTMSGVVMHGVQRGRTLGFPTANLSLAQGRVVPANGVYATWALVDGQRFMSVSNIGVRPTVNGSHRTVEAHIIDFDGDLYGRCIDLAFVYRLRDEVKFSGLDALKAQITRDRDRAARLLSAGPQVSQEPRFRELPHTADWAIEVRGETVATLYANAALAMFSLQGAADIDGPTMQQHFEITGLDREDLLVRWLSELLLESEMQEVMFQHFFIEEVDETRLRATATGRRGRSDLAHIKAVTYHDLAVLPPDASTPEWRARVLFDT
jgi:riboflavin kinase/FMN adenylyltransferase